MPYAITEPFVEQHILITHVFILLVIMANIVNIQRQNSEFIEFLENRCLYIAIIVMTFVAAFVIITDILKYGFGIDPTCEESRRLQQEKRAKRGRPVVQRFVYVNASKTVSQAEQDSVVFKNLLRPYKQTRIVFSFALAFETRYGVK